MLRNQLPHTRSWWWNFRDFPFMTFIDPYMIYIWPMLQYMTHIWPIYDFYFLKQKSLTSPIKLHKEEFEYHRKSQFFGFTGKRDNSVVIRSSLSIGFGEQPNIDTIPIKLCKICLREQMVSMRSFEWFWEMKKRKTHVHTGWINTFCIS